MKLLVVQGGGPTAVLNATLAGIVEQSGASAAIRGVFGSLNGVEGLLAGELADLCAQSPAFWAAAALAPGSVLGSSRRPVGNTDVEQILAVLRERDIRLVLLNGGNGTMELALCLGKACRLSGFEAVVIGVPKTIDNDLDGTDHTPGYGSAARFFAVAARDIGADINALGSVTFLEVLGRNVGWLAAATLLAKQRDTDAPHLVYLPERRLSFDVLAADVEAAYRRYGRAVVAVCEGQLDENGAPFGADVRTSGRAPLALNLAHVLSQRVGAALGLKARSEKPGLLGRSCSALVSEVDREEARECGRAAVRAALSGLSDLMVTLERAPGEPYRCTTGVVDLAAVAGRERPLPPEWVARDAAADMPAFRRWAAPLAGPVEPWPVLTR